MSFYAMFGGLGLMLAAAFAHDVPDWFRATQAFIGLTVFVIGWRDAGKDAM